MYFAIASEQKLPTAPQNNSAINGFWLRLEREVPATGTAAVLEEEEDTAESQLS